MIRVMVVDPDIQARTSIGDLLDAAHDIQISGLFSDGFEAQRTLEKHTTDVLITEMIMPRMDGSALLEHAASGAYGPIRVIVLN